LLGPIRASPARTYTYDYDRYGNRWGQTVTAGTGYNTQLSFNSGNNRVNTAGFTYDNSGNITDTALCANMLETGSLPEINVEGGGGLRHAAFRKG
jgi:YD repeat-containing protein